MILGGNPPHAPTHRLTMPWYELSSANDPQLNELATRYNLHPLHLEDARSPDERVKVDQTAEDYTFAVLKPIRLTPPPAGSPASPSELSFSTLDLFAGNHNGEPFLITIADPSCPTTAKALARARRDVAAKPKADPHATAPPAAPPDTQPTNPARLLYLILDTVVDGYFPAIDHYDDAIDNLEDSVVATPEPDTLQRVFALKRELIDLRRILTATRDATLHLQRDPASLIDAEHQPYVRDIYDHLVRLLDSVETQRDLVNNALDIYLSSVANRTNEVMKVLTIMGTAITPAIAISGIYGMNLKGLPWEDNPHGAAYVALITLAITAALLVWLRRRRWL